MFRGASGHFRGLLVGLKVLNRYSCELQGGLRRALKRFMFHEVSVGFKGFRTFRWVPEDFRRLHRLSGMLHGVYWGF